MNINAVNVSDFEDQFRDFLESEDARVSSIVYLYKVTNKIPRMNGESDIVYVGQTSKSFRQRYKSNQNIGIELDCFNNFYKKAIESYGPIRIEIIGAEKPKLKEAQVLSEYFDAHMEYPPLNRTIPKKVLNAENT